ncbi:uncharacterized protein [Procambarus clarkii]|uniref:uncharacterized protein n=1 Tax=Procambarus clarkii TaxID=6728 RepID=UPI003741EA1F
MALHRSSSSSFASTLLLHPLDIHFLAEPYGPPQADPTQASSSRPLSPHLLPSLSQSSPPAPPTTHSQNCPIFTTLTVGNSSLGQRDHRDDSPKAISLPTTPTTPLPQASSLPKVQVCGRGGVWWALNAGVLLLYRDLHARGHCSCIKAEVVPLHKVSSN